MLRTTLGRKTLMALTGLFLCLYLVIHLVGNLQLLMPPEKAQSQFNGYAHFLSNNPLIKGIAFVLFGAIIAHSVDALIMTLKNQQSTGSLYAYDQRQQVSTWYSRYMGLLGVIILVFLIIHLKDFWYIYTFGAIPVDAQGYKDLYTVVVRAFESWWYVLLNVVAFVALGYHLLHGFFSAFRTLGVYHRRYIRWVYVIGVVYTMVITSGFILIPIYIYVTRW